VGSAVLHGPGVLLSHSIRLLWKESDMRITKKVRQQLLDQNEGFEATTRYNSKNFTEYRKYTITNGGLRIHSQSKTSWADSRLEEEYPAS
jgi:hypothetical protein